MGHTIEKSRTAVEGSILLKDRLKDLSFSPPQDLGEAVKISLSQCLAYGHNEKGENEQYFLICGSPGTFCAVDAENGELKLSEDVAGAEYVTAMVTASDGNVYFSGSKILYRYITNERRIETLGENPCESVTVWELVAADDGKIYGACYPKSKVFEYDIEGECFTDLGTMVEGEQYARGLSLNGDDLYIGIGTTARLIRLNRRTGEKVEILTPVSGLITTIHRGIIYGERLLVSTGTELYILDKVTGEHIRTIEFDCQLSPPSPYNPDLIYFKSKRRLFCYNLKTDELSEIKDLPLLPDTVFKRHEWIRLNHGEKAGRVVLCGMAAYTESFFYDPEDGWFKIMKPEAKAKGVIIQSIEAGPGGKLYIGGYQRGMSIFDMSKDENLYTVPDFHQPEGIGFMRGKTYFGTYTGARIYRYDPEKDFKYNGGGYTDNPELICRIGYDQDRPFVITEGDNKLFLGTIPTYGMLGGALTVYEEDDGTGKVKINVHRNVVKDQSIIGLAYRDGKIYGGTAVMGGLGISPKAENARIFVWDLKKEKKLHEFTPDIPGMDGEPAMIGSLAFGPDGLLWGAADKDGTVFALEVESCRIIKSIRLYPGISTGSKWRPFYLRWDKEGLLYTTAGRCVTVIDPDTMVYRRLLEGIDLMALDDYGNIYYGEKSHLYKLHKSS